MSDFRARKYDYQMYYAYIGIRVRGKLDNICIFKEYWYGRRVDKIYSPTNPRSGEQQGHRVLMYDGMQNWRTFDGNVKMYYERLAKGNRIQGMDKYLSMYINANKPMIIYWGTLDKNAVDTAKPDEYMSSARFQGVQRIRSLADYPAGAAYGATFYHSVLDQIYSMYNGLGWKPQPRYGGNDPFPVGSVFISVVSTDPATLLGYGTWSAIATGRMLVGLDSGDTDFDTVEETGGAKTHTLVANNLPTHTHPQRIVNSGTAGSNGTQGAASASNANDGNTGNNTTTNSAVNHMNPYFVVYMWKRTA